MISSLFDKKTAKRFDTIAREKAKIRKKEEKAVEAFMCQNNKTTIIDLLDVVDENGHPNEKNQASKLREKYFGEGLGFDDVMTLETLYKSNYKYFGNKDENDE